MQPDLKARIEISAENNARSLNAEIVAVLDAEFPPPLPDDEEAIILALVFSLRARQRQIDDPEEIAEIEKLIDKYRTKLSGNWHLFSAQDEGDARPSEEDRKELEEYFNMRRKEGNPPPD